MWKHEVYHDISCSVTKQAVLSSVSPTGLWHAVNVFFVCDMHL